MDSVYYDGISVANKRKTNMDGVLLKRRRIGSEMVYIAVICDGVGSMADGEFASAEAIRLTGEWLDGLSDTRRIELKMLVLIKEINEAVFASGKEKGLKTASTYSALLLCGSRYYIVHVGDSRVYRQMHGELRKMTPDHSAGGKLTSYIGKSGDMDVFYDEGDYNGELFLLCSDGLYKRVSSEQIGQVIAGINKKSTHGALKELVQIAIEHGEHDNISAAILLAEN